MIDTAYCFIITKWIVSNDKSNMLELTHIDSFFDGWWTLLLKTKQRNHQFKQPKE